jgi:hypothetical protein
MPIPVASRSSDLATAEPSEWPTRFGVPGQGVGMGRAGQNDGGFEAIVPDLAVSI